MFEAQREHEYRQATHRNAGKMDGVNTQLTFVCKVCKQAKAKTGRVHMVPSANQFGYRCAECVSKRSKL